MNDLTEEDFSAPRPAIRLRAVDRAAVRQLVKEDSQFSLAAARAGHNIDQLALDRKDQIEQFMASLNEADAAAFSRMYVEEVLAHSTHDASVHAQQIQVAEADFKLAQAESEQQSWRVARGAVVLCLLIAMGIYWFVLA